MARYCYAEGCDTLLHAGRYCEQHKRRSKKKAWQSNNKSFYSSVHWRDLKRYCYERDGGCCQRCGKFVHGKQSHAHHIVPISVDGTLKLASDNIVTLCSRCHPIVEDETNVAYGIKKVSQDKYNWNL